MTLARSRAEGVMNSIDSDTFSIGPLISWSFPNVLGNAARVGQAEASARHRAMEGRQHEDRTFGQHAQGFVHGGDEFTGDTSRVRLHGGQVAARHEAAAGPLQHQDTYTRRCRKLAAGRQEGMGHTDIQRIQHLRAVQRQACDRPVALKQDGFAHAAARCANRALVRPSSLRAMVRKCTSSGPSAKRSVRAWATIAPKPKSSVTPAAP